MSASKLVARKGKAMILHNVRNPEAFNLCLIVHILYRSMRDISENIIRINLFDSILI